MANWGRLTCIFWKKHGCIYGENCRYRHDYAVVCQHWQQKSCRCEQNVGTFMEKLKQNRTNNANNIWLVGVNLVMHANSSTTAFHDHHLYHLQLRLLRHRLIQIRGQWHLPGYNAVQAQRKKTCSNKCHALVKFIKMQMERTCTKKESCPDPLQRVMQPMKPQKERSSSRMRSIKFKLPGYTCPAAGIRYW